MKKRILVVDDDATIRELIHLGLADHFDIVEAADLKTALQVFREQQPALVILDVTLPDGKGPEIIKELIEPEHRAVVIMLTSDADIDTAGRALELGASEYMTKPFDIPELRKTVSRWLGGSGPAQPPSGAPWRVNQ